MIGSKKRASQLTGRVSCVNRIPLVEHKSSKVYTTNRTSDVSCITVGGLSSNNNESKSSRTPTFLGDDKSPGAGVLENITNISHSYLQKNYKNLEPSVVETFIKKNTSKQWSELDPGKNIHNNGVHSCNDNMLDEHISQLWSSKDLNNSYTLKKSSGSYDPRSKLSTPPLPPKKENKERKSPSQSPKRMADVNNCTCNCKKQSWEGSLRTFCTCKNNSIPKKGTVKRATRSCPNSPSKADPNLSINKSSSLKSKGFNLKSPLKDGALISEKQSCTISKHLSVESLFDENKNTKSSVSRNSPVRSVKAKSFSPKEDSFEASLLFRSSGGDKIEAVNEKKKKINLSEDNRFGNSEKINHVSKDSDYLFPRLTNNSPTRSADLKKDILSRDSPFRKSMQIGPDDAVTRKEKSPTTIMECLQSDSQESCHQQLHPTDFTHLYIRPIIDRDEDEDIFKLTTAMSDMVNILEPSPCESYDDQSVFDEPTLLMSQDSDKNWKNKMVCLLHLLQDKSSAIKLLEKEIENLKRSHSPPRKELQGPASSLKKLVTKHEETIKQLRLKMSELQSKAQFSEKELCKAKKEILSKQVLLEKFNRNLEKKVKKEVAECKNEWLTEKNEIKKLVAKKDKENVELQKKLQISRNNIDNLQQHFKVFEAFINDSEIFFKEQIELHEIKGKELIDKLCSENVPKKRYNCMLASVSHLFQKYKQCRQETNDLSKQNVTLTNVNKELNTELQKLNHQSQQTAVLNEFTSSELMGASKELNDLHSFVQHLKKELKETTNELAEQRQAHKSMSIQLQQSQLSAKTLETTMNLQEVEMNSYRQRFEQSEKSCEELERISKELLVAKSTIEDLQNSITCLQNEQLIAKSSWEQLDEENRQILETQATLIETKEFLEEENRSIAETLKEVELNGTLCKMELSRCQSSIADKEQQRVMLKQQLDSLSDKYIQLQNEIMLKQKEVTQSNIWDSYIKEISCNVNNIEERMKNLLDNLLISLEKEDSSMASKIKLNMSCLPFNLKVKNNSNGNSSNTNSLLASVMEAIRSSNDGLLDSVAGMETTVKLEPVSSSAFSSVLPSSQNLDVNSIQLANNSNITREDLKTKTIDMMDIFSIILNTLKCLQESVSKKVLISEQNYCSALEEIEIIQQNINKESAKFMRAENNWKHEEAHLKYIIEQQKKELLHKEQEINKIRELHRELSDNYCLNVTQTSQMQKCMQEIADLRDCNRHLLIEKEEMERHLGELMQKLAEWNPDDAPPEGCISDLLKKKLALKQELSKLKYKMIKKDELICEIKERSRRRIQNLEDIQQMAKAEVIRLDTVIDVVVKTLLKFPLEENNELGQLLKYLQSSMHKVYQEEDVNSPENNIF